MFWDALQPSLHHYTALEGVRVELVVIGKGACLGEGKAVLVAVLESLSGVETAQAGISWVRIARHPMGLCIVVRPSYGRTR